MTGSLVNIFISPAKRGALMQLDAVVVISGAGLSGDRYCAPRPKQSGQNVTFIEIEEVERFNALHHRNVRPEETRRNVITRGIRLAPLVGRTFRVGEVTFQGVELCEPCTLLGRNLASDTLRPKDVIAAFLHRAGLRADALSGGTIRVGDPIEEWDMG